MIYITSDLHFGHNKNFLYEPRGFTSIGNHDKAIIENWNSIITNEDEIYILGDLMLNSSENGIYCLQQLNGDKYIIRGNHDSDAKIELYMNNIPNIHFCGDATIFKYHKYHFYLSHYPTITSNFDIEKPLSQRIINICGHSHIKNPFADWERYNAPIYHAELDAHNCYPISIEQIIKEIKEYVQNRNENQN